LRIYNGLKALPESFGQLGQLRQLHAMNNRLASLPSRWVACTNCASFVCRTTRSRACRNQSASWLHWESLSRF